MTAQIILAPDDVMIQIDAPSFPGEVPIGEMATGQLVITLTFQISETVNAVIRFPSPPPQGAFTWEAGDYVIGEAVRPTTVSVPIDFTPRGVGHVTQTLELISNAQGSPHQVLLQERARKVS